MTSYPLRVSTGSPQPPRRRGAGIFVRPDNPSRLACAVHAPLARHCPSGLESP
jgi:hypothetical protein